MLFHRPLFLPDASGRLSFAGFFDLLFAPPLTEFPGFIQSHIERLGTEIRQVFHIQGINEIETLLIGLQGGSMIA